MRQHPHPSFSLLTMPPSSSSSPLSTKPRKPSSSAINNHHHHHHHSSSSSSSPLFCRHHSLSATATLDLLILILVLFSGTFLLTSYFSYIFNSLSLLLPPSHTSLIHEFPLIYLLGFVLSFALVAILFEICCCGGLGLGLGFGSGFGFRSRKCDNPKCKGMKKAMEFDLQLQTEDCLKSGNNDVDKLPWKGGTETNPDYECLRAELRKMAPPNGRAVLLFRSKCGCPVAKLVGWGPKKGRKHKKALSNVAANGDHR